MAHIQGLDPKISKGIRIFDTCPYYKALVGHDPELPQSIRFGLTPYHLVTSVGGDLSIQIPFGNQTPDWTTQKVTFSGVGLDVDVGRSQEFSSVSTCVMQHGNVATFDATLWAKHSTLSALRFKSDLFEAAADGFKWNGAFSLPKKNQR